jgi:4-hydroxy-2-oxoheptanedioate aldolase
MILKSNSIKSALKRHQIQLGLWCGLTSSYSLEIIAGSGYDWLTMDMEHSPNDLATILSQLQVLGGYSAEPAVRLVKFDKDMVKKYLDIGVRTLILPNVESGAQAREIVAATRYPDRGLRGVAGQQRANRWGRVANYTQHADEQICVLAQIESAAGVKNIEDILGTDGIDGVFVGPNDLAASMGLLGQHLHPDVQDAIKSIPHVAKALGKGAGTLAFTDADIEKYLDWGYTMVGLGSDQGLLAKASDNLVASTRKLLATR